MKRHLLTTALGLTLALAASAQQLLPYQDPALSPAERADDLLGRLTLEQKVKLMQNDSPAIPELGIHNFNWWSEALHGAARSGTATVFPQAIGMAASFDDALLADVFDIASTEQRIKYIAARRKGDVKRYAGTAVWTPNINIFRDPRWGRGQETYGEDPYLTMRMGYAAVQGLQGQTPAARRQFDALRALHPEASAAYRHDKLHACLKHYAVHSGPEYERHKFDARDISLRDLAETYLYAFERLVRTTDVKEVMCAYNAFEGKPCCGSDQLLTQILRREWGYKNLVVSDCSAIRDFYNGPKTHNLFPGDAAQSSANAVLSGTDLECGSSYGALPEAVRRGAISEADLDVSVRRILTARFEMGDMDDLEAVAWNFIPESELATPASAAVAYRMALESMVLLQNHGGVLPLAAGRGKTYAVVGPNAADSLTLWGNYCGTPRRTVTVLDGIRSLLGPDDRLIYRRGSEWVAREVFESRYGQLSTPEGPGFDVAYWNNIRRHGEPVATDRKTSPFQLSTGGATVFAPGVALEDFSGRYTSTYHADRAESVMIDMYVCGEGQVIVAGDTLVKFKTGHGARRYQKAFKTEPGRDYDITVDFAFIIPDAQLNFDLGVKAETDIPRLVEETHEADVYIYVGGISPQLEGEEMKVDFKGFQGGDRTDIELPDVQRETLRALHATGKPVVFVNMSGSAIGLVPEVETCDAILQAWYGGQAGGQAVADVLFGRYNPAGRLPVTFYRDVTALPDYHDYNMAGHTYRYFRGDVLFPFGHGLSYSTFAYGDARLTKQVDLTDAAQIKSLKKALAPGTFTASDRLTLTVPVTNTSLRDGEEVVQLYIKKVGDTDGPVLTLRQFRRVLVPAGQTVEVELPLDEFNFRTFDAETGQLRTTPGQYILYYGPSSDLRTLKQLTVTCR